VLLMKMKPCFRGRPFFAGLGIVAVNFAQGFQHVPAFFGEVGATTSTKRRRAAAEQWLAITSSLASSLGRLRVSASHI